MFPSPRGSIRALEWSAVWVRCRRRQAVFLPMGGTAATAEEHATRVGRFAHLLSYKDAQAVGILANHRALFVAGVKKIVPVSSMLSGQSPCRLWVLIYVFAHESWIRHSSTGQSTGPLCLK